MGKRKKEERRQQRDSGLSARPREDAKTTAETRPASQADPVGPADVARRHRRRFGHN
ncbi:hypothetical protein [Streptomyces taklimakanensis]|uniref:hypothetical protein n=1 Tax=Streptomyces taklimakanensis TaxID=2569853 RepID=UPI00192E50DC|nr:hypothetical protein [Streptomyces taklimakanensis]